MRTLKRWLPFPVAALALALAPGCGSSDDTNMTGSSTAGGSGAGGSGGSAPKGPIIALVVDADRDGKADPASASDRAHRNDSDDKFGASFIANLDDDDDDGITDSEDEIVNGDNDALDLARITVAAWPDAPEGAVGKLGLDVASSEVVRIFKKNADGSWIVVAGSMGACTTELVPCAQSVTEATLTSAEIRAGVELGIESRRFRMKETDAWSGDVDLTFKILDAEGGTPLTNAETPDGIDHAKMRLAPWVLFGNLSPFTTVWASPSSAPFVAGITAGAKAANVTFKKTTGWGDQWTQDFFQTGWTAFPGVDGTVQGMSIGNARPWGRDNGDAFLPISWLKKSYLGADRGTLVVYKKKNTGSSYDSHGNHDLIPAYENAAKGTSFPLGRILTGSGILPETGAFYDAQKVQGPHLVVNSSWLLVGHVDEFLSYVPAATPRGWKLLVASPKLARTMLLKAQTDGFGDVIMFVGKKRWPPVGNTQISAEISINDYLADMDLQQWGQEAQVEIDPVLAKLKEEIGLGDDEVIEIPTIFEDLQGSKIAFAPGTVNLLQMGNVSNPPDPFGPKINGVDMWKQDFMDRLGSAANKLGVDGKGLTLNWVDDWYGYHINEGEVHCGSNPEASAPFSSVKWWETGK